MESQTEAEFAALASRVEELSQACARLSQQNAELHSVVARLTAPPSPASTPASTPAPTQAATLALAPAAAGSGAATSVVGRGNGTLAGVVNRRGMIGKALGVAAAGVVGAAVLTDATAGPAAATDGDTMTAGHYVNAEAFTGVEYNGSSNPGLIFIADDSGDAPAAVLGAGLTHPAAIGGFGTQFVPNGIYGLAAGSGGGDGVVGVNNSSANGNGVHGLVLTGNSGTVGVLGENSGDGIGVKGKGGTIGVLGSGSDTGVQGTGPNGVVGEGTGIGVLGSGTVGVQAIGNVIGLQASGSNASPGVGVEGQANIGVQGTGVSAGSSLGIGVAGIGHVGVHGTSALTGGNGVRGDASKGSGVHGLGKVGVQANGTGTGSVAVSASATASGGRGGVFAGNAAQVSLTPGPGKSHPKSGQRGDFYVDLSGRLWYCKTSGSTASWHQLA